MFLRYIIYKYLYIIIFMKIYNICKLFFKIYNYYLFYKISIKNLMMGWGNWKSMGPRRAWSHGPGRAGHPAASVARNPRAGLNQRPAPPWHGGTWRDPVWGGFVLRHYFGEPPHKTGRPNPPRRPLPRITPTWATAPPCRGQRSWRALAP